jgi:hypothetical protein
MQIKLFILPIKNVQNVEVELNPFLRAHPHDRVTKTSGWPKPRRFIITEVG